MAAVVQNPVIAHGAQNQGRVVQVDVVTGSACVVIVQGTGAQINGRSLFAVDATAVARCGIVGDGIARELCIGGVHPDRTAALALVAVEGVLLQSQSAVLCTDAAAVVLACIIVADVAVGRGHGAVDSIYAAAVSVCGGIAAYLAAVAQLSRAVVPHEQAACIAALVVGNRGIVGEELHARVREDAARPSWRRYCDRRTSSEAQPE